MNLSNSSMRGKKGGEKKKDSDAEKKGDGGNGGRVKGSRRRERVSG